MRYSSQTDVFSFGVLVLEVIAGQKNIPSPTDTRSQMLNNLAYKRWQGNATGQMIDPCLTTEADSIEGITRCIHIALLCVQEQRQSRPHMSSVVDWLTNSFDSPLPVVPNSFDTPLPVVPNPIPDPFQTNYDNPTTSNTMSISILTCR
ncbi:putative protein kinase RLK-Pelle-DLSV family [Helianthus anomalus]